MSNHDLSQIFVETIDNLVEKGSNKVVVIFKYIKMESSDNQNI